MSVDRAGLTILEHILRMDNNSLPGFAFGLKETIIISCWYLWWIHRCRMHDETVPPMHHCKMAVLAIAAISAKVGKKRSPGETKWCKPDIRQIKVNVDEAFYPDSSSGSVGAILRDHSGKFISVLSYFLPHVSSARAAEVMAMKEGLDLANRTGCSNIVAELDSTEIVEACTREMTWFDESAAAFADCVDLATLIGQVYFKHCPREENVCRS
jgi:ribonuclease HI